MSKKNKKPLYREPAMWALVSMLTLGFCVFGGSVIYTDVKNRQDAQVRTRVKEFADQLPGYKTFAADSTALATELQYWQWLLRTMSDRNDRALANDIIDSLNAEQGALYKNQYENNAAIARYLQMVQENSK